MILHPASYGTKDIFVFFPALCCEERRFFMQKNKSKALKNVKVLTVSAMMIALSAVIGYVCKTIPALNLGTGLRITFENLPIIVSGIMFGPIIGGCVGCIADLLSCLSSGQAPLPWVLVGSISVGVVAGVSSKFIVIKNGFLKLIVSELLAHLVGSMVIKTIALYAIFGPVVLFRIPMSIGIAAVEIILLCAMYKNKTVRNLIDSKGGRI